MAEITWIGGSGRVKKFAATDDKPAKTLINLSLKKADIDKIYESKAGYVFIQLSKKPEADKYGNEFSISEDSWASGKAREKDGEADDMNTEDDQLFGADDSL